jgi:hypothetical protein
MIRKKPARQLNPDKPEPQQPLRVKLQIEEVEDEARAADMLRRILRAQAAELEEQERMDDAP